MKKLEEIEIELWTNNVILFWKYKKDKRRKNHFKAIPKGKIITQKRTITKERYNKIKETYMVIK